MKWCTLKWGKRYLPCMITLHTREFPSMRCARDMWTSSQRIWLRDYIILHGELVRFRRQKNTTDNSPGMKLQLCKFLQLKDTFNALEGTRTRKWIAIGCHWFHPLPPPTLSSSPIWNVASFRAGCTLNWWLTWYRVESTETSEFDLPVDRPTSLVNLNHLRCDRTEFFIYRLN